MPDVWNAVVKVELARRDLTAVRDLVAKECERLEPPLEIRELRFAPATLVIT
jgi:hypothetical protein